MHLSDEVLADLRERLPGTRWPEGVGYDDPRYGVTRHDLRRLADHWAGDFDWRTQEAAMNKYEHYRVDVEGVPIHVMRRPGTGPAPKPLIMSHGWPWTFWHFSRVVDELADPASYGGDPRDAFDVVVPSLPGFGFSSPVSNHPDMNFWKISDLWNTLMTEVLGHEKYAAAGCDVGALVTAQLGHKYADRLYGIHIGSGQRLDLFTGERAWDVSRGLPVPASLSPNERDQFLNQERRFAVHLAAHVLAPHTLAFGLNDSPVGVLAWLLERWTAWSDSHGDVGSVFSDDDILTHATIYWATQTIGTSMRTYANNHRYPWVRSHDRWPVVEAPTGLTLVGFENPPGVSTPEERVAHFRQSERASWYNLKNVSAHPHGGHFIPWELPREWVADIRDTFRET